MAGRLHEEWDVLAPQLATSEHPAQNTTDAAELVQRSVVFAGDLFFQSATCENWPMTWVAISSARVALLLALDFLLFDVDFDGSSVSSIFTCSLRTRAGFTYHPRHMSVRP